MQNSVALYSTLERETGQAIDWHEVGSVRLASSQERWSELKRAATTARGFNFEMELISPEDARTKFEFIQLKGVVVRRGSRATVTSILEPDAGARKRRTRGWREDPAGHAGHRCSNRKDRRITRVLTNKGADRLRDGRHRGGNLVARRRQADGRAHPGGGARAPVHGDRADEGENSRSLPTLRDPDLNFYLKPESAASRSAAGRWARRRSIPTACRSSSRRSCCRRTWSASRRSRSPPPSASRSSASSG